MKEKCLFWYVLPLLALGNLSSKALILFGADNSANTTDPGTGVPYASVARLSNGMGTIGGSGVHLGGGYILTANHVGPFSSVTFDGVTHYSHDGLAPQQIGTTDMKIFRLTTTPSVPGVRLYNGTSELTQQATLVGWGVGRNPAIPVDTNLVSWGNASTSAKRWGLNIPNGVYDNLIAGAHTYDIIHTTIGSSSGTPQGLGAFEAAATLYDSGSGMFQFLDGQWFLTGLTTNVSRLTEGSNSTFGNDTPWVFAPNTPVTANTLAGYFVGSGDVNIFARISSYESDIIAIIPEPTSFLLNFSALFLLLRRRR